MDQQTPYTRQRLESVQGLRGLAALAVVLFHLRGVELKYLQGNAVLDTAARYADAGVDLFFVLSGFVMTTIAASRYARPGASSQFLAKRAWRVLPMYWIFTTSVVVLMTAAPGMANSSYAGQSVLASYLLLPHAQLPVLTVGWTLVHEAYFYLVFAVAIAWVRERFVPVFLLAWAAVILLAHLQPLSTTSPAWRLVTNPLTYEFIAGALLGLYWRRIPRRLALPSIITGAGIALVAAAALPAEGPATMNVWTRVACFGTSAVLLVAGAVNLEAQQCLRVPGWISRLGDSSYSLYLSHLFVISAAGRIWAMVVPSPCWIGHVGFVVAATVARCVVGYVVHWGLERPLLAAPRRWCGLSKRTAI